MQSQAQPWEVPSSQLELLLGPLGLREICHAAVLLPATNPDSIPGEVFEAVAALVNQESGRAGSRQLSGSNLQSILTRLQGRFPLSPLLALAMAARQRAEWQLAGKHMLLAVSPHVTHCQRCGLARLQLSALCRQAFFYCEDQPPQQGTVHIKTCLGCHAVHHVNGWQDASGGQRHMYADKEAEHPFWEVVTKETVVATRPLQRHLYNMVGMQASFQESVKEFNKMQGIGAQPPPGHLHAPPRCSSTGLPPDRMQCRRAPASPEGPARLQNVPC